jgi:hypothetical protein
MARQRSQISRKRRADIADAAYRLCSLGRNEGRTIDRLQEELLQRFAREVQPGEARMYAMGWTVRVIREGLRGVASQVGLEASGVDDRDIWRWLRGEVRPTVWMDCLCRLFCCHQAQLGWPPQGNETPVDHTPAALAPDSALATAGVAGPPSQLEDMSPLQRRTFVLGGAGLALPFLTLDDLRHVVAALRNAPRYADPAVVDHYRGQLLAFAADDGKLGARRTLPLVLGTIGAIEQTAREARPIVRRDLLAVGARCAEFAGWLYRDLGVPELAMYWRDRATEWAQEAGDSAMQGYVLLKKSQAAWDQRDATRMLTLAQAVQEGPWRVPVRVRAEAAQQEARAYAMLGADVDFVERKLDEARNLLSGTALQTTTDEQLSQHYTFAVFAMQSALCYCEAGRPGAAVDLYAAELTEDAFSRRDYGYFTCLKGCALAALGEPDEAAIAGMSALAIATATSSQRTMRELVELAQRLSPWAQRPQVSEPRAAVGAQ